MSNYTEKHTKKYMKKGIAAVIFLFALCLICGCGQKEEKKAVYEITAEGSAQESGVIAFAGLEMNVYQDPASNPCGDCPDQPVSIYVGTDTPETVEAMAEAVRQSDPSGEDTGKCDGRAGAFRAERFDADGFFFPRRGRYGPAAER